MEKYHTQWAAQFYTAAELTRRGYTVSLTLGNAKGTDLLVKNREGCYSVEVKGAKTKAGWYVKESPSPAEFADFFILVYVPEKDPEKDEYSPPEFFVLTGKETMDLVNEYVRQAVSRGRAREKVQSGVSWGGAESFKNKWDKLRHERDTTACGSVASRVPDRSRNNIGG